MLNRIAKEIVEKYSFVKRVDIKAGYFYVFYDKNGVETFKRISIRATKEQLQKFIKKIMDDYGYEKYKEAMRIKIKQEMEEEHAMYMIINNGGKNG